MNCSSCGSQLPPEARACPNCGALTPNYYSNGGPTVQSSYNNKLAPYAAPSGSPPYGTPSPMPPTDYGQNPYGTPTTDPYNAPVASNPYSAPAAPPPYAVPAPVPPPPHRNNRLGIIIGIVVLVVVLIGAGVFVLARSSSTTVTPTPTAPTGLSPTQATTPSQATQTPATTPQGIGASILRQATSGTPVISDSLRGADNFGWSESSNPNSTCAFTGGAYHSSAKPGYFSPCYATSTNFGNLAVQVQITLISGHSGGLLFHSNPTNDAGYQFRISTDGTYILNKSVPVSNQPNSSIALASGHSAAIKTGNNQPNLVAVIVQGGTIYLYVNKQYVDSVNDSTYTSGPVGVYVDSDANPVEAMFSNLQVWKL